MAIHRVELPKLAMCRRCGYVACICQFRIDHAKTCTRRRAVLGKPAPTCTPHQRVACWECYPCDCRKVPPP